MMEIPDEWYDDSEIIDIGESTVKNSYFEIENRNPITIRRKKKRPGTTMFNDFDSYSSRDSLSRFTSHDYFGFDLSKAASDFVFAELQENKGEKNKSLILKK